MPRTGWAVFDPDFLASWGTWLYLITFGVLMIDGLFPFIPGELLVIAAGALIARGELNLAAAFAVVTIGASIGDFLVYQTFKRRPGELLVATRWGSRISIAINKALEKAGPAPGMAALVVLRFIAGGRTASMAAAGMLRLKFLPWLGLTLPGAALWTAYMLGLGWFTDQIFDLPLWATILVGMGVGVLVGTLVGVVLHLTRSKPTADSASGEENDD